MTSLYALTPSQTVGPFFAFGLLHPPTPELIPVGTPGGIRIKGTVTDGQGKSVPDAMLEIWQAGPSGRYAHPEDPRENLGLDSSFTGFGRNGTDENGTYWFHTVKPGTVPWVDARIQAPHLNLSVFARGLGQRLVTRIYFPDEVDANAVDPVLCSIEKPQARSTLIAKAQDGALCFDIHLQGERETCFFQI